MMEYLNQIDFKMLDVTAEVLRAAERIIEIGILTRRSFDDCQHLAAAVVNQCDCIYELTKDMTDQEKIAFYNEGGRAFLAEMQARKRKAEADAS